MKSIRSLLVIAALIFSACEKDNYDGPTAGLSGSFIDGDTKQLIEQDIIGGTQIELLEHGYDPVEPFFLIVKNDGTYENSMLFENMYTVTPVRGNFIPIQPQELKIAGKTKLDFTVTPYIRVLDAQVTKSGTIVTAKFRIQQNVTNNVKKIGLYVHSDSRVGEPLRLAAAEQDINAVTNPQTVYTLSINVADHTSTLKTGKKHYFRVGAQIDAPSSKLNYAKAVEIQL
ncbi:DUF3823 domain-containing protein [Chitinophaga lutea]